MANGEIRVDYGPPTSCTRVYQSGDVPYLTDWLRHVSIDRQEMTGDVDAPRFLLEVTTTRYGHEFKIGAVFDYQPDRDVRDGVPYGFQTHGVEMRLANPRPGQEGLTIGYEWASEAARAVTKGEAQFVADAVEYARLQAQVARIFRENPQLRAGTNRRVG